MEWISMYIEGVAQSTFEFEEDMTCGLEPYTINWDFGDGNEESDEESVVHTFDEAGTYVVTATVIDSAGQTADGSIEITVEDPDPDPDPDPDQIGRASCRERV